MIEFTNKLIKLTGWLEDYPDYFVIIISNPSGIAFPYNAFPVIEDKIDDLETHEALSIEIAPINRIQDQIKNHKDENICRSYQIYSDKFCSKPISCVPFIIDIDNNEKKLEDAYSLTQGCIDVLRCSPSFQESNQIRIVFSGAKGFHTEVKPNATVSFEIMSKEIIAGLRKRGYEHCLANQFVNGAIDKFHSFVRLTQSYNSWFENGILMKRKVIQYSLDEFEATDITNIIYKSEHV